MTTSNPSTRPPASTGVFASAHGGTLAGSEGTAAPKGRLEWPLLLAWLREDGWITTDDAERVTGRFRAGASSLHALVRLGGAGLLQRGNGRVLDTEVLTEWLASRCRLPYLRIDPLRVDVGRVTDVMSVQYAQSRHALPVSMSRSEETRLNSSHT